MSFERSPARQPKHYSGGPVDMSEPARESVVEEAGGPGQRRLTSRPFLAAVFSLLLLSGAGVFLFGTGVANANEVTGLIVAYNSASERITLGNGRNFSVPLVFLAEAAKIGSVVKVSFENFGEDDEEERVNNIELVCKDLIGAFCQQFQLTSPR